MVNDNYLAGDSVLMSKERPQYRSAMFVALENDKGEFLLQLRTGTGFLDGYYDLASGHLEYGESFEECAARETKEEYGVDVAVGDLVLTAIFQSDFNDTRYLNAIYRAQKFTGEPRVGEPEKIAAIGWFAPDNFPEKLTVGAWVFLEALGAKAVKNWYVGRDEFKKLMGVDFEQI